MLSARFRTALRFLNTALLALMERGQDVANAAVAAIGVAAAARQVKLTRLMDRFEAGLLRPRAVGVRRAVVRRAAWPQPAWPWFRAGWLNLVGINHPSYAVRQRWMQDSSIRQAARVHCQGFAAALRALVDGDAAMQGLLEASGEARRLVRWFLRAADAEPLPAVLVGTPRRRAPRAKRVARPWRKRAPAPFEAPPETLLREERVARGMWVEPAIRLYDPSAFPITPDWVQRERR